MHFPANQMHQKFPLTLCWSILPCVSFLSHISFLSEYRSPEAKSAITTYPQKCYLPPFLLMKKIAKVDRKKVILWRKFYEVIVPWCSNAWTNFRSSLIEVVALTKRYNFELHKKKNSHNKFYRRAQLVNY